MFLINENEVLIGTEKDGFTHHCWLYKERIIIKDNTLFLEVQTFDIEKEEYVLFDEPNYEIQIDDLKLKVILNEGLGELQLKGLKDIVISGEPYHFKKGKWFKGERKSLFSKMLKR